MPIESWEEKEGAATVRLQVSISLFGDSISMYNSKVGTHIHHQAPAPSTPSAWKNWSWGLQQSPFTLEAKSNTSMVWLPCQSLGDVFMFILHVFIASIIIRSMRDILVFYWSVGIMYIMYIFFSFSCPRLPFPPHQLHLINLQHQILYPVHENQNSLSTNIRQLVLYFDRKYI